MGDERYRTSRGNDSGSGAAMASCEGKHGMTKSFLLGLITGATTVWVFKDAIATRIDARTRTIRARTAHALHAADDAIESGIAGAPPANARLGSPVPPDRVEQVAESA